MGARVLLVAWKGATATAWVHPLSSSGYTVLLEDTTGERAWRTAKERGIDVVIIDGEKKPSHGRQTGHSLRDTAKTREIPIIWTNLDNEDSAAVQTEVRPDVTLMAPTEAIEAIAALDALGSRIVWQNGALFDAMNAANGVVDGADGVVAPAHTNGVAKAKPVRKPAAKKAKPAKKTARKAKASAQARRR